MATERVVDLRTGVVSERTYTPPPAPVPQSVTRRQAKLALLAAGLLEAAEAAIEAAGPAAQIEWADALAFERNHPLILAIGTALGLAAEQIDTLFQEAIAL